MSENSSPSAVPFRAETRQILDILIHSLYTEREIFLRELISNASDALTRIDFEMLTNRNVLDADAELGIWINFDADKRILSIRDTGIGMTADELSENLGTIAHSGAKAFIQAAQNAETQPGKRLADIIGQFGVGFYSVFMVAESVSVISRSYRPDSQAAKWYCTGGDTYTVEKAEKKERGTLIEIVLKEDATEFAQEHRLREIIHTHSDFIPFPIYLGDKTEQINKRTAVWRKTPRELEEKDYQEFYKQLTLDFDNPIAYTHLVVDAPAQVYAILFVPSKLERGLFSLRKEEGLKLYARKVLIQNYTKDLLPEYLGFIQGVVDSEDLPLNVSRESVQSNRIMVQLKKLITNKAIDMIIKLASDEPEKYIKFWEQFGRYIKQGIAIETADTSDLASLIRFHSTKLKDEWSSLSDYVSRMKDGQEKIYYIVGDDKNSVMFSPHLDVVRKHGYEVILMTDPIDAFMLIRLKEFQGKPLENVAQADLKLPPSTEDMAGNTPDKVPVENWANVVELFKIHLGDRVSDVRMTDRLADSPARLVDPDGSPNIEMQRVYRMLNEEFEIPKKTLELNPGHPIVLRLSQIDSKDERIPLAIEQIYENALLIEGLMKEPAGMIGRIHKLIEAALK